MARLAARKVQSPVELAEGRKSSPISEWRVASKSIWGDHVERPVRGLSVLGSFLRSGPPPACADGIRVARVKQLRSGPTGLLIRPASQTCPTGEHLREYNEPLP